MHTDYSRFVRTRSRLRTRFYRAEQAATPASESPEVSSADSDCEEEIGGSVHELDEDEE